MSVEHNGGDPRRQSWAERFSWLRDEPEVVIAFLVAVGVAVYGLTDNVNQPVQEATLVVLALIASTLVRSRIRTGAVETELRRALTDSGEALHQVPERLAEVTELLERSRQAIDQMSVVSLLPGAQVRTELVAATQHTNTWIFKGGTGTFIRAFTLPECVENSRAARRQLQVQLEIIDPENDTACAVYARFRQSLVTGRADPWTADRVRKEAYATILAASWYRRHNDFLTVRVGLSSTMTTCRWDMSASRVIVTREDPTAPALVAYQGKLYYSWCETELNSSYAQSRRLPVENVLMVPLSDEPTVEEVRELFEVLGLSLDALDDSEVADVTRRALRPAEPYR
ncbi:hypothetical protein GT755_02085 [Herbidospora sp. NEAU-GS84]|uniref:Uncharacterized protein n=1 Tax=Herbidospora solisilvae TaxID=2696284 RepID=A0A7C9MYI8_9ACTN|nr:hypothetical protein [Herbidospora solisilvae]NAS20469.1 hypothetical protein [Herbidospora solisilvae]